MAVPSTPGPRAHPAPLLRVLAGLVPATHEFRLRDVDVGNNGAEVVDARAKPGQDDGVSLALPWPWPRLPRRAPARPATLLRVLAGLVPATHEFRLRDVGAGNDGAEVVDARAKPGQDDGVSLALSWPWPRPPRRAPALPSSLLLVLAGLVPATHESRLRDVGAGNDGAEVVDARAKPGQDEGVSFALPWLWSRLPRRAPARPSPLLLVLAGLVPATHEFRLRDVGAAMMARKSWMPGPSPGKTMG